MIYVRSPTLFGKNMNKGKVKHLEFIYIVVPKKNNLAVTLNEIGLTYNP